MEFRFIVLSKARPGREKEFVDWYGGIHVREVLEVPGILSGQFFECAMVRKDLTGMNYTHMAEYECEADSPQVIVDGLSARQADGLMRMSDSIDPGNISYFFTPLTERMVS